MVSILFSLTCEYQLDTTRHAPPRDTLGEEIWRVLWDDLSRSAPEKAQALEREKARFVRAVDALLPEPIHDDLQAYLVGLLPLFDQEVVQAVARTSACILRQVGSSQDALDAAWYSRHPAGYGDSAALLPFVRRLAVHQAAAGLLQDVGTLLLAHDGLDEAFRSSGEDDTTAALLMEVSRKLQRMEIEAPDPKGGAEAILDFLLSEDSRLFSSGEAAQFIVRTDVRGRAIVASDSATGSIPAPFADIDSDGLADVDPSTGDFIDAAGNLVAAPPPFDGTGNRPQSVNGGLVYRYCDLSQAKLSALLAELRPLISEGLLWRLPDTLGPLLGPAVQRSDEDGAFQGHEPDRSAAVAFAHALLAALDYPRLPELLDVIHTTAETAEPQIARLLASIDRAGEVSDRWAGVSLAPHNRLLDDLLARIQESAERGYLLALLRSFDDPRLSGLQAGLADMIRYRDMLSDTDMTFRLTTDFTKSDTDYFNRSNFQRAIHLIYDGNGVRHSVSIMGWEPFAIEDMLVFYLDSGAGDTESGLAVIPWYVDVAISELTSETPPAEEMNRFLVHNHDVLGNPKGNEGRELREYNGESLLALELSGGLNSLRPVITAFATRDRDLTRPGTKVLADLLAAVHPHFSSNLPGASPACANLRVLEPMLLEVFDTTDILNAVTDLLAGLKGLRTPSGIDVLKELDGFVRFLITPNSALVRHDGSRSVAGGDGQTQVSPISPFYLVLDATRALDDAFSADAREDEAFNWLSDLLYDRFLATEEAGGLHRFKNRRGWLLLLDTVEFLAKRTSELRDEGSLSGKLVELDTDLRDAVGGRLLPRIMDVWRLVAADPRLPQEADGLVLDLLDEADLGRLRETRKIAAWGLQHLVADRVVKPWARVAGRYIDPSGAEIAYEPGSGCQTAAPPSTFIARTVNLLTLLIVTTGNGRNVFSELLPNSGTSYAAEAAFPLDDLSGVIGAVHRLAPAGTSELSAADFAHILGEVSDYVLDERRGLEKLYKIIERRDGL